MSKAPRGTRARNPIDAIPPKVTLLWHDQLEHGNHVALVHVEPAVGDPYDLPMEIDPDRREFNLPMWKQLSESQQQHVRVWAGTIASAIICDRVGRDDPA